MRIRVSPHYNDYERHAALGASTGGLCAAQRAQHRGDKGALSVARRCQACLARKARATPEWREAAPVRTAGVQPEAP